MLRKRGPWTQLIYSTGREAKVLKGANSSCRPLWWMLELMFERDTELAPAANSFFGGAVNFSGMELSISQMPEEHQIKQMRAEFLHSATWSLRRVLLMAHPQPRVVWAVHQHRMDIKRRILACKRRQVERETHCWKCDRRATDFGSIHEFLHHEETCTQFRLPPCSLSLLTPALIMRVVAFLQPVKQAIATHLNKQLGL